MDRIGVAIVGLGYWGPNLARNFARLPNAEVVTLCDSVEARAQAAKTFAPRASVTTNFEQVLQDPGVQAVVLCTPVRTHYTLAYQALRSGRHVLVEKPLTTSVSEAQELVELARGRGLVLMTGHTFLYSPPVRKIKELLDEGAIGPVLFADSNRVNLGLFRGDTDVLWDLGPHDISILAYLLGTLPAAVAAGGAAYMQEGILDMGYLHLAFPGGQTAHVVVSWLAPVKLRRMTVVGREGMIVYDDTQETEKVKLYRGDNGSLSPTELQQDPGQLYRLGDVFVPSLPRVEPLHAQCEEFLQCIRTGATPLSDGALGLQVVRTLDGAHQSLIQGGQLVSLTPMETGR